MNKKNLLMRLGMQEEQFEKIFGKSIEDFFDTSKNGNLEKFVAIWLETLFNK